MTTNIFVNLPVDEPVVDAHAGSEVLVALSFDSADAVRETCERAFAAGARRFREPRDLGFMFSWAFEDPDGHIWECLWMDPAHLEAPTAG
jgi:predicted lactoylglutathione lyase